MKKSTWMIWLALLVVKLVIAIGLPLSSDEAYYWVWGQNLQLSYFDHPGMIGWLNAVGAWLGNLLVGDIALFARVPGILLVHLTPLMWIGILQRSIQTTHANATENWQAKFILFCALFPLLGLTSLVMTPDAPLIFFWSLSIYFFRRALDSSSPRDYALLGIALGLGFCSKYHIVLFIPAALLALYMQNEWRKVRWQFVLLTALIGLIFCLPVLYWNFQNDFISFQFQLRHGLEAAVKRRWLFPIEYIGAQIGILFPTVIFVVYKAWQKQKQDADVRYLYAFACFPLLFFLLTSFRTKVEANWPIAAYPAVAAIAYFAFAEHKKLYRFTLSIWASAWILILSQAAFQWLPNTQNSTKLKTYELIKFNPLLERALTQKPFFASSYQMAAYLSYKTRSQIYKLRGMSRVDFYDFQSQSVPKEDHFFLALEAEQKLPQEFFDQGFRVVQADVVNQDPELRVWEVKRAKDSDRK